MTTRTVEQVSDWESRSFSGGYRGLQDLSDERFSGIVTAGPTRLCMTKGKVVGVLDGDIDAFEGASGTAHVAPSPALPLLAVMQDRSDEVRAQYYTEETPISEVDQTLSDGNFTGFVELSENVLSGDYYLVYHQGRSMNVAFVGESKQLLTDDEAFERTSGEVGIYKVKPVDIDVIEIPEVEPTADDDTGAAATAAPTDTDAAVESETDSDAGADTETTDAGDAPTDDEDASPDTADADGAVEMDETSGGRSHGGDRVDESGSTGQAATRQPEPETPSSGSQAPEAERTRRTEAAGTQRRGQQSQPASQSSAPADRGAGQPGPATQGTSGQPTAGEPPREAAGAGGGAETTVDLETRSIPSLDPDRTSTPSEDTGPDTGTDIGQATASTGQQSDATHAQPRGDNRRQQQPSSSQHPGATSQQSPEPQRTQNPTDGRGQSATAHQGAQAGGETTGAGAGAGDVDRLQSELEQREEEVDRLEAELETVEGERDDLEAELERVRAERDDLEERVEQLERRVNELRTDEGGESVADRRRMSPGEVIDGTNLFVRYKSKGNATLEAAYKGNAEATAVNDNLDIQHHTQFDAEDVAVNGEPFTEYLHGTLQYAFVEWVVRVLPYEIRDTGHAESLRDLYEALPDIDRAELNGTISVVYEEGGEEQRTQETFDVVLRDRMGNPLAMANMNESRQPATQSMMESLITASQRVGESKESLAGSFLVTSSFFEPEAMEAAEEATGSGLLSRDKRESFVKLSRKEGFHLCLVQYLDGQFELSVPEL